MIPPLDPSELPPPAQKALSPTGPPKMRAAAARGILPGLRGDHIVTLLVGFLQGPPGETAETAEKTLFALPEPVLNTALSADLQPTVIDALAYRFVDRLDVVEQLVRMPRLATESVEHLAKNGSEQVTELIATNEERMLANPQLIEKLYLNNNTRMSTADRLIELAVRNGLELTGIGAFKEAAQAIQGELICEATDEPLPEDLTYVETSDLAEELAADECEDVFFEDEEGDEHLEDKMIPLYKRIAEMPISQKIRRAILGTKEERMLLVRDTNKIISRAAATSPQLQEPEVMLISRNRNINEDVLRIIGTTPEWLKSYQIKKNLVENAKTPIMISQRLVTQLRESDLRKIAKSKNVSGAVQTAARRHLERRKT